MGHLSGHMGQGGILPRVTVFSKLSIFWLVIGFIEYLIVRPKKCRRDDNNHKTR